LFGSPRFAAVRLRLSGRRGRGIGLVSLHQDLLKAAQQFRQDQQISCLLAQGFGLLSLGFHVQQQVFHRAFPKAV